MIVACTHDRPADDPAIEVRGTGAELIPRDAHHPAYRAARFVAELVGESDAHFRLVQENAIPPTRGLGGSAAALVGGAVAANDLFGGQIAAPDLLNIVCELDGQNQDGEGRGQGTVHGGLLRARGGYCRWYFVKSCSSIPGIRSRSCSGESPWAASWASSCSRSVLKAASRSWWACARGMGARPSSAR